jgi:hypothetical protein
MTQTPIMENDLRMSADRARQAIEAGKGVLVCAYDEEKCQRFMFEGALTAKQLEERRATLPEDASILFYCA